MNDFLELHKWMTKELIAVRADKITSFLDHEGHAVLASDGQLLEVEESYEQVMKQFGKGKK